MKNIFEKNSSCLFAQVNSYDHRAKICLEEMDLEIYQILMILRFQNLLFTTKLLIKQGPNRSRKFNTLFLRQSSQTIISWNFCKKGQNCGELELLDQPMFIIFWKKFVSDGTKLRLTHHMFPVNDIKTISSLFSDQTMRGIVNHFWK